MLLCGGKVKTPLGHDGHVNYFEAALTLSLSLSLSG